jgi:hypothetical protein
MNMASFDFARLRAKAWIVTKAAAKLGGIGLGLAIGVCVAVDGWNHVLLPDIALLRELAAKPIGHSTPPSPVHDERLFCLLEFTFGLLLTIASVSGFEQWWARYVSGKSPDLLAAKIGELSGHIVQLETDLEGAEEAFEEIRFDTDILKTVLQFPGVRPVVLAALHPDRGKTDGERHTLTERFQLASSVFDDLAEG